METRVISDILRQRSALREDEHSAREFPRGRSVGTRSALLVKRNECQSPL